MSLENEMAEEFSRQLAKQIDESILLEVLVESGWTKVPYTFIDILECHEVTQWCDDNLTKGQWNYIAGSFVIRKKKEAEWFILRWV